MIFAIGDVVVLRTGSPLMTVRNTGEYERLGIAPWLLCEWMNGTQVVQRTLAPAAVEHHRQ